MVAFSSGNHARGVAIAARRLGIRAVIVMPADAPQVKVEGTRAEGAEIIFYDRRDRKPRGDRRARSRDESGRDGGAELRRSGDRRRAGHRRARNPRAARTRRRQRGSSFRAAAAGWPRGSRWPARTRRSSSSSPRAGTTWRRSLERGRDRAGRRRTRRRHLCDALQTPRVSPITFGILQRARRAGAVRQR